MQIFGECRLAVGAQVAEAIELYSQRFPDFWKFFQKSEDRARGIINFLPLSGPLEARILRFFVVKTKWLKLFDEANFGKEPFITLTF